MRSTDVQSRGRLSGFTLVELLVVIAVLAILVGLVLPGLAGARKAARSAVSLSNLRQCGQVQHAYAGDYKGSFVNPFDPRAPQVAGTSWYSVVHQEYSNPTTLWIWSFGTQGYATQMFGPYWLSVATQYLSPNTLASGMMFSPDDGAGRERFRAQFPAQADIGNNIWDTSYWSSPTLWLSADVYRGATRTPIMLSDSRYLRRNRIDDAVSPQAKAMVFERFDFSKRDRPHAGGGREAFHPMFNNPEATTRLMLVDGSAATVKMASLYQQIDPSGQGRGGVHAPSGDWDIPDSILGDPLLPVGPANRWNLGRDGLENGDGSLIGVVGGFSKHPAFLWATRNGIQGRDIAR